MKGSTVTGTDVRRAIRELGLGGRPVCVHSSLRSFGWVEGGANAVIDAFLAEGCTLIVPSHSYEFAVGPPPGRRPPRNGLNYDVERDWPGEGRVFSVASNEISREMGAIPAALLQREGRVRGNNPIDSFAALGTLAGDVIHGQTAEDVYAPMRRLCELNGFVVLMGVGLDNLTLLHYAEVVAGRQPFIEWANGPDATVIDVRTGGCSTGFPALDGTLAGVERRLEVGSSLWRMLPAKSAVDLASAAIRASPEITRCSPDCRQCADAILGGPVEQAGGPSG